jgi:hypothetical protein
MEVLDCQPSTTGRYNPKYGFQAGGEGAKSNAPMEGLKEGNIHLLKNLLPGGGQEEETNRRARRRAQALEGRGQGER